MTRPYGFVAPNAKVWFQKFEEIDDNGKQSIREYLMTTGFLWTGQYPECQAAVDEGKPHSMEIDEDTLVIVTADHGHIDILDLNLAGYPNILKLLERLPSIEPRACTFFVKEGKEEEFKNEFNSLWKDDFLLLTKEEVLEKNIFGVGVPHPTTEYTIGQFTALATNRLTFSYHENLEEEQFKATHAGLTEDEMIIPLILLTKKGSK